MVTIEGLSSMDILNSFLEKLIKKKLGGDVNINLLDIHIKSEPLKKIVIHINGELNVSKDDLVKMIFRGNDN